MIQNRRLNECGVTLIELLAALTIFMLILISFYNVLIGVVENIEHRKAQEDARREANYVLSLLTNVHQTSSYYELMSIDDSTFQINYVVKGEPKRVQVKTTPYQLELILNGQPLQDQISINTTKRDQLSINVSLTLTNHQARNDEVHIETIISRMSPSKGGGSE